jgi:phage baseplate assembly protein W
MTTRVYSKRTVATQAASVGAEGAIAFTYKGFNSNDPINGFKSYDIDLVKQDIVNHFNIRKGEKLMNPEFGTIIWDLLFEQFTPEVRKLVIQDVETIINYDPRIAINAIVVDSTDQGIRVESDIIYLPFNVNEKMTFDFDRENGIVI